MDNEAESISRPRLTKMIVTNFRSIGSNPVEVELDDIVVLVGPNNTGKSTILRAYQIAMSEGGKEANLTIEDFPGKQIDAANPPTIELHTIYVKEATKIKVAEKWLQKQENGEKLLKERWVWLGEGAPNRQGWDKTKKEWSSDGVPSGAAGFAKNRMPEPHYVDVFDSPDTQAKEIIKLIRKELDEKVKSHRDNKDEESDYQKLIKSVALLQTGIVKDAKAEIDKINEELTALIQQVFPDHKVDFDAKPDDNLKIDFFKADPQLLMGIEGEHMSTVDKQGSGARRTLLWTVIKFAAENARRTKGKISFRPHILLLDEPEICLHPTAIRDACNALYALPESGSWQVMLTTHSPIFIDFSKDNTTVVRVIRSKSGDISTTTVYRPQALSLSDDDKQNLKMLNICDPYVAEFFFGGKIVIVEGDTEYTAFKYVISQNTDMFRDVHIIRARGKATIVTLIKVLNHFGADYAVLHDSDRQKNKNGDTNSAWTNNSRILDAINNKKPSSSVRLIASIPNFEEAYLGSSYSDEKPYKALKAIMEDNDKYQEVEKLLKAILDKEEIMPQNCIEWENINQLAGDKRTI